MGFHIKSTHDETKGWCGETLGGEFHFKTVDAAVLNGMHDRKPIACESCTGLMIICLMAGVDKKNNEATNE